MVKTTSIFSVDWEDWNHALHTSGINLIEEPTLFLLDILEKYGIKAIFYMLGRAVEENKNLACEIQDRGHIIGDHGMYHDHNEYQALDGLEPIPFRSPYWDTTPMPWPPSGGFFFRVMPLWYIKWAINKSGHFWIHPHDVMENHPTINPWWLNLKRQIGLKGARTKLDLLLSEVQFGTPK